MSSKAVKIVAAICIACVAIQAIIWIGVTSFDREHLVPGPAKPESDED